MPMAGPHTIPETETAADGSFDCTPDASPSMKLR